MALQCSVRSAFSCPFRAFAQKNLITSAAWLDAGELWDLQVSAEQELPGEERASLFYRPEYERMNWGGRTLHLFWFRDRNGRRTHQMIRRHDPRVPAREVKADLVRLSRSQFEAKYAPFRLATTPESGDVSS